MRTKSKQLETYTGIYWPLGAKVSIQRPHLWSGYSGEIVAVDDKRGVHRVKITHEIGHHNKHSWHVEAPGDLLKPT